MEPELQFVTWQRISSLISKVQTSRYRTIKTSHPSPCLVNWIERTALHGEADSDCATEVWIFLETKCAPIYTSPQRMGEFCFLNAFFNVYVSVRVCNWEEEDVRYPVVTGNCDPVCGCGELILGPMQRNCNFDHWVIFLAWIKLFFIYKWHLSYSYKKHLIQTGVAK